METLADQLSTALDSARLYQDTQRRAVQEQLVGEITTRMRESLDMETVLKRRSMRCASPGFGRRHRAVGKARTIGKAE